MENFSAIIIRYGSIYCGNFNCLQLAAFSNLKMTISLLKYLNVTITLFLLGIWGIVLNRKNIIILLMSIELMLLSINLNFVTFSVFLDDLMGQVFALFVLTVAAAESAIGLAILVAYYRVRNTIAVEDVSMLRA